MNYKYVNASKVYAWLNGALRCADVIEQMVVNEQRPVFTISVDGQTYTLPYENVFLSVDDYKTDTQAECNGITPYQIGCFDNGGDWNYFTNLNGRVVQKSFEGEIVCRWNADTNKYDFLVSVAEEMYRTEEVCREMGEFVSVDENGNETTHQGTIRKIMPTDAQRKAMAKVEKAIADAQKLGLSFAYDNTIDKLLAYNNLGGRVVNDWDGDMPKDEYDIVPAFYFCGNNVMNHLTINIDKFGYTNDDCCRLYIKK